MNTTYEYTRLLKNTLNGINLRTFFFGETSKILEKYIKTQERKILKIEEDAYKTSKKIRTRENAHLGAKLFGLETRIQFSKFDQRVI